jgi:hypothetical protein
MLELIVYLDCPLHFLCRFQVRAIEVFHSYVKKMSVGTTLTTVLPRVEGKSAASNGNDSATFLSKFIIRRIIILC